MLVDIKVPALAESVADGTLIGWQKKVGDAVSSGETLVEVETDKVVLEVTSPDSGVIKDIVKGDNETVLGEEVIAILDTEATAAVTAEPQARPAATPQAAEPAPEQEGDVKLSPAVRKLLEETRLDPNDIPVAAQGRVTKADVLGHLESGAAAPKPDFASTSVLAGKPVPAAVQPPVSTDGRGEKRVPMTRLRKRIAERLLAAQHQNAILTTFNEVDMQPVMALRSRYKEQFEKTHDVRLGFMSFFVKASIEALKQFPVINASIDGEDIVYHEYFDVGIAVSSPRGLVVPIVRDADQLGFADIERAIGAYGRKARDGDLTIEDLTGGNFTITNGGIFGSLLSTPILNPPQSAILGMHKIQDRPMAVDGEVVVRPMMYLALSYDHRIVDGKEAVQFLVTIKEQLEDPARLLLQI